jgi:hypothetical protein
MNKITGYQKVKVFSLERKLKAMAYYHSQLKEAPHPRSL